VANLKMGRSAESTQQISSRDQASQETVPVCQFLDWDSTFFGRRIARATSNRLDAKTIKEILKWSRNNQIDCLYFLADAEDDATIKLAEENRFHFVDVRVTFERQLKDSSSEFHPFFTGDIRPSRPKDIPELRDIARTGYRDTRFYYDSHFPAQLSDELYETWIEKSCKGYADVVLVAEVEGEVVGYISCHLHDSFHGQIGLVGVHSNWRGNRIGQALVNRSVQWFSEQGVNHIDVVTQGRNIQAQRLYEKCGFLTCELQIWYHHWFLSQGA